MLIVGNHYLLAGIGNPKKASAGKGKKYAEAVVAKYALLFEELVHKELY